MAILIFILIAIVALIIFAMKSKANIFRAGIFKNMRSLFSGQKRIQKVIMASETGVISLEQMPMDMSYVANSEDKTAWLVIHTLKSRIKETGDVVLVVSEKNYIPADPYGRVTDADIQPLEEIALAKYDERCVRISEKSMQDSKGSIYTMIVVFCFCIIAVSLIFGLKH